MTYFSPRPRLSDSAPAVLSGHCLSAAEDKRFGILEACAAAGIDAGIYRVLFAPDPAVTSLRSWQRWYLIQMTDRQIMSRRRSAASVDDEGWAEDEATRLVFIMQTTLGVDAVEAALDVLSGCGVPLIDLSGQEGGAPEFYVDGWDVGEGKRVGTGRASSVLDGTEASKCNSSAAVRFARDWLFHVLEAGLKNRAHQVWKKDANYIPYFLAFAQEWGQGYGGIPRPSQACISYCRDVADGGWRGRAYGESVTTLALERFQFEYAWAKRARYHFGVDRLIVGENYGHAFSRVLDTTMEGCSPNADFYRGLASSHPDDLTDHQGRQLDDMTVPGAMGGYVMSVIRGAADADKSMAQARDRLASWGISQKMFEALYTATGGQRGAADMGVALDEALDGGASGNRVLRDAVPGLIAGAFLEGVDVDPDYYFILTLMLFMEAEAGRTDFSLLPRYHPAYRVRVREGKNREDAVSAKIRGIVARRSGSAEYLDEHYRFAWFYMGVSRVAPAAVLAPLQEAGFLPGLIGFGFATDGRRGVARQVMPVKKRRQRKQEAEQNAVCTGIMLEMVARVGLWERDTVAWREARYGRSGCHMKSAAVRLSRHAYAQKFRPYSLRKPYVEALGRPSVVVHALSNEELSLVMGSFLPAEFLDMIARQHRNEYRCGYGVYGAATVSRFDAGIIARDTLAIKLRGMGRATFAMLYGMEIEIMKTKTEYVLSEPWRNVIRSLSSVDLFNVSARTPKRSAFDADIRRRWGISDLIGTGKRLAGKVGAVTYRQVMRECGIMGEAVGGLPFVKGLNDRRVFDAWKAEMLKNEMPTSRNMGLAFLMYVGRRMVWSKLAWVILAVGGVTQERITQAREADVSLLLA